ncbi:hypothetical protein OSB04_004784 [Centaurea solstitialis]|uniref:Uncharacterized protein n=1 Tax=Centaurea solstitialis TaxID=347529 RepID=A0AA38WR27_9ASTR|nr:hypothetical protein OSB04_004784 [Centaurea solstitialis]
MLDADLTSNLADSGIGELCDNNSWARADFADGYLAPEYLFSGVHMVKAVVHSFRVVVSEVTAGSG